MKATTKECEKCGKSYSTVSHNSIWCENCRTVMCKICGTPVVVKPSRVEKVKYCSKECRRQADMNYVWQDEDLHFISKNYPFKLSMKEIAAKYSTSVSSVNRIIAKLNLPKCPISLRNSRGAIKRVKWTKSRVVGDIQFYHANGVQLNSDFIQKTNGILHNRACALFGSWKEAIEAAGITYDDINLYSDRRTWSRSEIIAEIKDLHENGTDISASYARDNHADLFNAARREPSFQTDSESQWEVAILAAGINYVEVRGEAWGSVTQGHDGKTYPSRLEASVADALLKMKLEGVIIEYLSQVPLAVDRAWRCDFLVTLADNKNIYLEVDGLGGARKGSSHTEKMSFLKNSGYEYNVIRKPEELELAIFNPEKYKRTIIDLPPRRFVELGERRYTDQDIIDELKRVEKKLKRVPTQIEFTANAKMSAGTISLRLGWYPALRRAKLIE